MAFGALVLIAMVPKEIWIALGVLGGIALLVHFANKHFQQKAKSHTSSLNQDPHRHEPTLAELTAENHRQRSRPQPAIPPGPSRTALPDPSLATSLGIPTARIPGQSDEWNATREIAIEANRERTQALRDKLPPTIARSNDRASAPLRSVAPDVSAPSTPQDGMSAADTTHGSTMIMVPGQSDDWNNTRKVAIEVNRGRTQALRKKFARTSPEAIDRTIVPIEQEPPSIFLLPPTSARRSGQDLTPSPPPTPVTSTPSLSAANAPAPKPDGTIGQLMRMFRGSPEPEAMYSAPGTPKASSTHALPAAPVGFGDGRWIRPGESIEFAGVNLPGGMLYVGGRLNAPNGHPEPCLISGQLHVARAGNYRSGQMGYWPSYAHASAEERRAYLNWLSEGRSHPDCDIGYVFLFFYGLERRVIVDSRTDSQARSD